MIKADKYIVAIHIKKLKKLCTIFYEKFLIQMNDCTRWIIF
jgi:hypothetical protein